MSKVVKDLIINEYRREFNGVADALLVDIRELKADQNIELRKGLRSKGIRVTVVRNALAAKAFDGTALSPLDSLLTGPSAIVYGGETVIDVAREVMTFAKKLKKLELKGAILDGEVFKGKAGVEALSKYPTRTEALGQAVQLVLSPGASLVGAVVGPGGAIASILKTIEEKLEKGETIAKAG